MGGDVCKIGMKWPSPFLGTEAYILRDFGKSLYLNKLTSLIIANSAQFYVLCFGMCLMMIELIIRLLVKMTANLPWPTQFYLWRRD